MSGVLDIALPCRAAGLLSGERLTCNRLRDHCVDPGCVNGALRMVDQRLREGEHDRLVLLDDRQSFLIAVLDEGRAARVRAADDPDDGRLSRRIAISAAPRSPSLWVEQRFAYGTSGYTAASIAMAASRSRQTASICEHASEIAPRAAATGYENIVERAILVVMMERY